jgi:hypothetical protein
MTKEAISQTDCKNKALGSPGSLCNALRSFTSFHILPVYTIFGALFPSKSGLIQKHIVEHIVKPRYGDWLYGFVIIPPDPRSMISCQSPITNHQSLGLKTRL